MPLSHDTLSPQRLAAFWAMVDKNDPSGCWLWTGHRCRGYGRYCVAKEGMALAHRLVYALLIGPPPAGYHLHHECPNKHCVNPEHLLAVPPDQHPDQICVLNAAKTHCIRGHEFTPENTYPQHGGRACRQCERERQATRAETHRAEINAQACRRRAEDPEKQRQAGRRWRAAHLEEVRARDREQKRQYRLANLEKMQQRERERNRARKQQRAAARKQQQTAAPVVPGQQTLDF